MTPAEKIAYAEQRINELKTLIQHWKKHETRQKLR